MRSRERGQGSRKSTVKVLYYQKKVLIFKTKSVGTVVGVVVGLKSTIQACLTVVLLNVTVEFILVP